MIDLVVSDEILGARLGVSPPCDCMDNLAAPCDSLNTENRTLKTVGSADTIGATSNHPFWSVDRQEYVQAGSLKIGERLLTLDGTTKTVAQKLPRPGPQPVFNLEVHTEHVYFVGEDGVLVHNSRLYDVQRPGGYKTGDVDMHGRLSPQKNRATGHLNTPADGCIQSHHPVQQAWAKANVPNYNANRAPAILLSTAPGQPHDLIGEMQLAAGYGVGNSLRQELNRGYRELLDAGVSQKQARRVMTNNYKYFVHELKAALD